MFISGKKRRLTLIEVNNDISNMIDVAKVADLVCLFCTVNVQVSILLLFSFLFHLFFHCA